ncbi:HDL350Cp [Eremothecium sinecaudum]|uniref:HDL350Cp n=1 Tax=Eremothecium sinecaudum TaxID=45286 RepID=A0A0X8HS22_9SACH|nr:HDL350Cp [Eremothecium sinecaudum]AMD20394.1 HDL350Cp [Eremothecium sinecaudum]
MDLFSILDTAPEPAIVDAKTMGVSGDTSGDYWLPAPMCLYQKELTDQIVSLHYSDILKYFETSDYKEDIVLQSMKTMCLNSQLVATHPYLLIDHFMPKSLLTKDIPVHLAETSGKFAVLRDLLTLVQEYHTNTLIVCRPGRTMDLVEALLLGNKVNIKRYDGQSIKSKQKKTKFPCTCHLLPSETTDASKLVIDENIRLDLMICVDPTVDTSVDYIQRILKLQKPAYRLQSIIPTIRLTVINSIDHCELYFGKKFDRNTREYVVNVSAAMVVLRDVVGTLPPDLRPIYSQNLRYLADWLNIPESPWPLPDIYPIKIYTAMDVERSLLTEVKYSQTNDSLEEAFLSNGKKRLQRYTGQDSIANSEQSYYQVKRLKKDYITNPLKQDMAQLTGISDLKVKSAVNDHLGSDILTHRLIQNMGVVYSNLKIGSKELMHFDMVKFNQGNLLAVHEKNHLDIKTQLEESNRLIEQNESQVEECLRNSDRRRLDIEREEAELQTLLSELAARSPDLKDLVVRIAEASDELKSVKQLITSKDTEMNYIQEEIRRAKQAISENVTDSEQIEQDIKQLEVQLSEEFAKDKGEYELLQKDIAKLREEISTENDSVEATRQQMSDIMQTLRQLQTPRVRSSVNGTKAKNRGYV